MQVKQFFFLIFVGLFSLTVTAQKKYSLLCLGDSYTIGESVAEGERFPNQAVHLLEGNKITFENPVLVARTGWTTGELVAAIKDRNITQTFDFVTLLIGVNNEFRELSTVEYQKEFNQLLQTAIHFANGNAKHVIVISIPDWGATPFIANDPQQRTAAQVGNEIDQFNAINKKEAKEMGANYIDITPFSRKAAGDRTLVAEDGLHPSGKMYANWAEQLAATIKKLTGG